MGDRHILTVICPECGAEEKGVFYGPSSEFVTHDCSVCGFVIDLEKHIEGTPKGKSDD